MAVSTILPSQGLFEEKMAPSRGFTQNVREAAKQPLQNLKETGEKSHKLGRLFVCLARPKMIISQFVTGQLRKGWEKAGVDSMVHTAIAGGCNAVRVLNCFSKRKQGARELREMVWITARDVAEWQVPAPAPQTLVKARKTMEAVNRTVPFTSIAAQGIKTVAASANWVYRSCYGEDLLPALPSIPQDIEDLVLGNYSGQSFSERVDAFFVSSLVSNPIVVREDVQEKWCEGLRNIPILNFSGILLRDILRLNANLSSAVKEACRETIDNTRGERLALIEALEGFALSYLYKKVAAQLPGKEILIREATLYVLQNYFGLLSRGGLSMTRYFFPGYLKLAVDGLSSIPTKPLELSQTIANLDFVESAANKLGALADASLSSEVGAALTTLGGTVVGGLLDQPAAGVFTGAALSSVGGTVIKQAFLHGTTKGLEYGPPAAALIYQILYQELDRLASRGEQRFQAFSSFSGWLGLFQGNSSEAIDSALLDPNRSYLAPIASEFILGTISRLCEGNGMVAVLQDLMTEITKKAPGAPSASLPTPGMEESKAALERFVTSLKASLTENLHNRVPAVFEAERQRQIGNATEVSKGIEKTREAIQAGHAELVANGFNRIGVGVSAGTVSAVLDLPNTILSGAASGVSGAVSGLINYKWRE